MFISKILPVESMLHPARRTGSPLRRIGLAIFVGGALLVPGSGWFRDGSHAQTARQIPPDGDSIGAASPSRAEEPDSLAFAIADALAEIRRHPNSGSPRLPLAEAYRSRGNLVAARATVEEGLRLGLSGSDSIRAVTILADIALKQGRQNEARTRLAALATRSDAGADLLAMLAQIRWDDHQPEEALTLGMEAVAREPGNVDRLRWVAEHWKQVGRADQALKLRKRVIESPTATDEDFFQVGYLSHQLGDGQTAIDTYLRLLERRPTHPQGNYNLSLLMLALGDTLDAARRLEAAILGDPRMQRAYFDLAVLYLHGGRLSDARRVLTLFKAAAGADSLLNAEVEMILGGLTNQKDRPTAR